MADYRKMYHKAFSALTDSEQLISQAARVMRATQIECEEMYTEADDTQIELAEYKPEEQKPEKDFE